MRELQTERLILRPLELSDAAAIQRLFPRWEVVRWLSSVVPWPYPADGALTYVRDQALPATERGEAWHWTIRLKATPQEMVGLIALVRGESENRGFWIVPELRGRGLMTEAAERVTAFWFDELGMTVLRVPKALGNVGSRRISEKQGMRMVGLEERNYVSGRAMAEVWEITAEEWRARRGRRSETNSV
jgi:RimJ/RimL family protein N-acetyltransferase